METEIFKKIKKETLTPEEKLDGLSKLKNFIIEHPVEIKTSIKSPFWRVFLTKQRPFALSSLALLLIFITGGTAIASNYSLPGDILYPIKRNVNERVEMVVAIGTKAKTEVKIKHAVERLKEAEILSEQNRLDEQDQDEIDKDFSAEAIEVSRDITKLKDSGREEEAEEVDVKLDIALEKHKIIMLKLSEKIKKQKEDDRQRDNSKKTTVEKLKSEEKIKESEIIEVNVINENKVSSSTTEEEQKDLIKGTSEAEILEEIEIEKTTPEVKPNTTIPTAPIIQVP